MKKAFTLIELLVVIAIIAILAAILFPVFAQAKAAAKKTADLNNQKQINTGVQVYLSDSDDTFPLTIPSNLNTTLFTMPVDRTPTTNPGNRQAFWGNSVQMYIKNWQMYTGPGASVEWNPFGAQTPTPVVNYNYTVNPYLNNWSATQSNSPAKTVLTWNGLATMKIPGYGVAWPLITLKGGGFSMAQLGTSTYQFQNSGPNCTDVIGVFSGTEGTLIKHNLWARGDNLTYTDGHAKFVKFGSSDFPWIVNADGTASQFWTNTKYSADGCRFSYTLDPMIEG